MRYQPRLDRLAEPHLVSQQNAWTMAPGNGIGDEELVWQQLHSRTE